MEIRVRFEGGPIDGEAALSESLEDVKAFFPPGDRSVLIYKRDPMKDELTYYFDLQLSMKANDQYDKTRAFFEKERPSVLEWVDLPEPEEEKEEL